MFTIEIDSNQTKSEFYQSLASQLEALLTGERDFICNAAQFSAFIMQTLSELNWAGFYLVRGEELVLGPYVGKVACTRIPFSRGVCGKTARTGETQRVDDVHAVADHIACDAASNAEIVIPVKVDGRVIAVFDIDSPTKQRFDLEDQQGIERLVDIWQQSTDLSWQF